MGHVYSTFIVTFPHFVNVNEPVPVPEKFQEQSGTGSFTFTKILSLISFL